jgi:hypothetical protein
MVGPTAQLVALACHLNGRARGKVADPFFPSNSTCKFCEYIRFIRPASCWFGKSTSRQTQTPDEWLTEEAKSGKSAMLLNQRVGDPRISDRMSAGFVGGGGRWLLMTTSGESSGAWEGSWEVGDRKATDQRIWRVTYTLVAENSHLELTRSRPLQVLHAALRTSLEEILAFAERNRIESFAGYFQKGIACLSSDDPFKLVFHRDLAPAGLLEREAEQMLAASQASWVFGGMGSWNDMGFDGNEQVAYERVSDTLFSLLNECICAATNSTAVSSAQPDKTRRG